jgi:hypothetical protein
MTELETIAGWLGLAALISEAILLGAIAVAEIRSDAKGENHDQE